VVYARIAAPIPTTAAVITSPTDGTDVTHSGLTVSGTCPVITPRVIIAISDNGTEVGSVACGSDNTFSIPITLTPGQHTLIAETYTITDDTGPDSAPITITYTPPPVAHQSVVTTTTIQSSGSQAAGVAPLTLTIDEPFIVFGPAKDAIWLGSIGGGTTPYQINIDWGDGTTRNYTITSSGQQHFVHHYRSMQPHDITFHVTDAGKQEITRHYAAVTPYVSPVAGNLFAGTSQSPFGGSGLFGLYGAYLLLLAIFGGLWVRAHPFAYAKAPVHHRHYATSKHKRKPAGH
jgi:hypothetical protein